ncbi:DUF3597 domain-containing protein [Alteriqipengyuania flavescens]|uniref:DUF3597 domain-containing protein n=1 Tax=Alteriqipengyuania flavescens TaxID=3053610 RepID=UPI0025B32287|nr:DUF3597 domain-containing protein [Alteriqipengyuania flavescens]WJY18787.1 DUF3597 domain-containing protein [Alteriqipengyuania flavescens]WJY24727.1 DUF3597 domain-containing protein [Alteriqipengyuania flavescens]
MGIFSSIKNAIFGKDQPKPAPPEEAQKARDNSITAEALRNISRAGSVDVEDRLSKMDGADRLNWRTSIVDLMKLLGIDSSYENRKELAQEMGRTDYEGSAEDNIWLHRRTMQELALNGGKVPDKMLD